MDATATGAPRPLRLEALVTSGLRPIVEARLIGPLRIAAMRPGVTVRAHLDRVTIDETAPGTDRVFLRYRPHGRPEAWPLQRQLLRTGYLVIADVDDLLWEGADATDPAERRARLRVYRDSDHVAYRGVHAIQVSTPVLAEQIRRFNPNVRVFPAAVASVPALPARPVGPPRVVFAALNRAADWQPILAPLNRVLRRRPDVTVVTVHDAGFHAALETANKQLLGFQPYPEYLATVASCDVALLPLGDSRFNRSKSDLKFVECASRGAVALASTTVYGDSIVDGETGLLYRTPDEFEARLDRLLADSGLRSALARAAHDWVGRHRRLADGVDARLAWYRELLADKPSLDAGIRDRAGWILEPDGLPPMRREDCWRED